MKKVIDGILDKHTKLCTCREVYKLNEDLEITIDQKGNKITMWGFNNKSERSLNLSTKRFERLMNGFKAVSSDLYADSKYYYITLNTSNTGNRGIDSYELEIEELKKKVACLNDIIVRLERSNDELTQQVCKYREDYLYYYDKCAELRDKEIQRTLDDLNKSTLKHNARGAGRKVKFTDAQVSDIKKLRTEGKTIKEIANVYSCSVGLIHKLINEK